MDSLQKNYDALQAENKTLDEKIKKLRSEKEDLENILKAESDELSNKIVQLRIKIEDLEGEKEENNRTISELKKEISALKRDKEESLQKVSNTYNAMIEKMKSEIAQGQITITKLQGKLTVNMLDAILFDLGKAEIRSEGLVVLQKLVEVLKGVDDRT